MTSSSSSTAATSPLPQPPPPSLLQTRLGPIECLSSGAGPAVLALHGGMGGYDQSLLLAQAAIDVPARVLAVSRPGYLGTPLDSGATPEQQADLCAALLDELDIAQATVIAVSAGGPCALQFALRHPDRCSAVVLVSACTGDLPTPPGISRQLALMRLLARIPFVLTRLQRSSARDPDAAAQRSIADPALRARTLDHPRAGPLLRALLASVMHRLPDRLPGTVNDTARFRTLGTMPFQKIAAPVLVIHGTADRIVPFAHGKAVADRAPHAELLAIAGGEHVCLFTHLDTVRARVGAFLAGHAGDSAAPPDIGP